MPRRCKIPGCQVQAHDGGNYCTDKHRELAVEKYHEPSCLLCKKFPRLDTMFCGRKCLGNARADAPRLFPIPHDDPKFSETKDRFQRDWLYSKPVPDVAEVYKVVLSDDIVDAYEKYRAAVEDNAGHKFTKAGKTEGNEIKHWHGTHRACSVGDNRNSPTLCGRSDCPMCAILKNSFKIARSGRSGRKNARPPLFGKGAYTSSASSKANIYASNSGRAGPYKAMIFAYVARGRSRFLARPKPRLRKAPKGYQSVVGKLGPRGKKYEELIVYRDDAILPGYLVVYKG